MGLSYRWLFVQWTENPQAVVQLHSAPQILSFMTFLLNKNSQEIRDTLKDKYKLSICVCSEYKDSCWLAFHPYLEIPYNIHGVGYWDEMDEISEVKMTSELILKQILEEGSFIIFDNVDEFGTACRFVLDNWPEAQGIEDKASLLTMLKLLSKS